jgi:hypothetical protein
MCERPPAAFFLMLALSGSRFAGGSPPHGSLRGGMGIVETELILPLIEGGDASVASEGVRHKPCSGLQHAPSYG